MADIYTLFDYRADGPFDKNYLDMKALCISMLAGALRRFLQTKRRKFCEKTVYTPHIVVDNEGFVFFGGTAPLTERDGGKNEVILFFSSCL